jgi:hypothetical protein
MQRRGTIKHALELILDDPTTKCTLSAHINCLRDIDELLDQLNEILLLDGEAELEYPLVGELILDESLLSILECPTDPIERLHELDIGDVVSFIFEG